jgi:hypothetical protein
LLARLEIIDGVDFRGNRRQWPRTSLEPLAERAVRSAFLAIVEEVIDGLGLRDAP